MSSVKLRSSEFEVSNELEGDDAWIAVAPPVQGAARTSAAGVILSIARLRERRAAGQDHEARFVGDGMIYGGGDSDLADDLASEIERTGWNE